MKMYKKPTIETLDIRVENLMLNVSVNGEGSGEEHPQAGMPKRGSVIP